MTASPPPTADRLLDAAEAIVQSVGYAGLSFRDLAASVGISSASVHYHYPSKADLGLALARRYTDRLQAHLDALEQAHPPQRALARYVEVFRRVLLQDGRMCLCGMLAAEADAIPAEMRAEVARFVEMNVGWAGRVLAAAGGDAGKAPRAHALALFASLEGALLVARATGDGTIFDVIEARMLGSGA